MSALCIPDRETNLTMAAVAAVGTATLVAMATPAGAALAITTIATAAAITLRYLYKDSVVPSPHSQADDWIADIRRQPARMRGRGAASLLALPSPIYAKFECVNDLMIPMGENDLSG